MTEGFLQVRRLLSFSVALMSVAAMSACSPKTNYAIPERPCGLRVDKELVRPFFPPGEKISTWGDHLRKSGEVGTVSACNYKVDGKSVLFAINGLSSENLNVREIVKRDTDYNLRYTKFNSTNTVAMYKDSSITSVTECHGPPRISMGSP